MKKDVYLVRVISSNSNISTDVYYSQSEAEDKMVIIEQSLMERGWKIEDYDNLFGFFYFLDVKKGVLFGEVVLCIE